MIDVRALRTLFGTPISKGRVAPRTAQAAARHSKIDPATNVYTNPKLLDVYGALDSRPSLNLDASPSTEHDASDWDGPSRQNTGKRQNIFCDCTKHWQAGGCVVAVHLSDVGDERETRRATRENRMKPSKKDLPAVFADKALRMEDSGIEPLTSCMP